MEEVNVIKFCCTVFLVICLTVMTPQVLAFQDNDSLSTINFLNQVDKVESLSYKVLVNENSSSAHKESEKNPIEIIPYYRETFDDFSTAITIRDSLINAGHKNTELQFFIFDEEKRFESIIEYISIVKENDLFLPKSEDKIDNEAIIIAANRVPFQPFYDLRFRILSDIKLLILLGILALFLITFLVLFFFLVVVRSRNAIRKQTIREYTATCQAPLSNLLFEYSHDQIASMEYGELKKEFSSKDFEKPLFKDTLISEIVNVNKNLKGDFKDKLREIYRILKLDQFSIQKLKSGKWDLQSAGIVELYEMNIQYAMEHIEKLISSKNFIVRTNAVRAMLHLSKEKDLKFLAEQKYPLSKWQQMAFYRVLKDTSNNDKLDIINLLLSENISVRVFGIKLVRFLGKLELVEKLSEMFPTASHQEKCEILITLKNLTAFNEIDLAHEALFDSDVKIASLSASLLGMIGNEDSVELLVKRLSDTDDFNLQMEILTSLSMLDDARFEMTVKALDEAHIYQMRDHIKDNLLTYV